VATHRGVGVVVLVVVAGLVVGSLLGELLGGLTTGWVQELFTKGPSIGLTNPATLDLRFLALTFGLVFKVNLVGVVGIVIAALALRRL
jgi:NhaP-type Na+/H+ or K+/H+ antiporter